MTKITAGKGKVSIADFSQRKRVEIYKEEDGEFAICMVNTQKSRKTYMYVSESELKDMIKAMPRLFE